MSVYAYHPSVPLLPATLVRAVTGRVIPAFAGMIAGIVNSTLQISAALSVAVIGGIFSTVLGTRVDPASIAHAFVVAMLCMAACLIVATLLGVSLAWRHAEMTPTRSGH